MSLKNSICSLEQERISCKSGLEAPNNCLLAAIACQISGLTLIRGCVKSPTRNLPDYLFSFPSMRTN
jgi:hypothetical protein